MWRATKIVLGEQKRGNRIEWREPEWKKTECAEAEFHTLWHDDKMTVDDWNVSTPTGAVEKSMCAGPTFLVTCFEFHVMFVNVCFIKFYVSSTKQNPHCYRCVSNRNNYF